MNKICTSLEQSKKLIELGIDVNTADMIYQPIMDIAYEQCGFDKRPLCFPFSRVKECNIQYLPAWSFAALLEILPNNEVTSTTVTRGGWSIEPIKYLDIWFAEYETEKHDNDFSLSADNPIDAAFEMIVWLKENGKI